MYFDGDRKEFVLLKEEADNYKKEITNMKLSLYSQLLNQIFIKRNLKRTPMENGIKELEKPMKVSKNEIRMVKAIWTDEFHNAMANMQKTGNPIDKSMSKKIIKILDKRKIKKGTPMENEIKELENQLKNNKDLFKIVTEKRNEYNDKFLDLGKDIQRMETKLQNLKDQQCLKASDFPCLGWGKLNYVTDIHPIFCDEKCDYLITKNIKFIEKHKFNLNNKINGKIHVSKVKFSDIEEDDYFIFDCDNKNDVTSYCYCDKVKDASKDVLRAKDGLIIKTNYYNTMSDYICYKFTIKEN
jgi:hypothetical protein